MSDADLELKALLAVDEPPARDPAFTLAVMEQIARRRLWAEVLLGAPVVLAACVALWALSPVLTQVAVQWVGPLAEGAVLPALAMALTLAAMALMGRDQARS